MNNKTKKDFMAFKLLKIIFLQTLLTQVRLLNYRHFLLNVVKLKTRHARRAVREFHSPEILGKMYYKVSLSIRSIYI